MTKLDIKELLRSGKYFEIAVLVECNNCDGRGKYAVHYAGGPYGFDETIIEPCKFCYNRSGKQLKTVPFNELVQAIKETSNTI